MSREIRPIASRLDEIQGAVALAHDAVLQEAGTNAALTHAWCSLGLVKEALSSLRGDLDAADTRCGRLKSRTAAPPKPERRAYCSMQ